MDNFAHLTAGYSLTKFLIRRENSKAIKEQEKKWLAWGIFCSQIPDLDEILSFAVCSKKRKEFLHDGSEHHGSLMHLPIFYFSFFFGFYSILKLFQNNHTSSFLDKKETSFAFKIFVANITLHLLMDSLGMGQGLRWLYPFKKDQVGVGLTNKIGPEDWKEFYFSPRIIFELMVLLLAGFEVFWERHSSFLTDKIQDPNQF